MSESVKSEGKMSYERQRAQAEYEAKLRTHATQMFNGRQERFMQLYVLAGALMAMQGKSPADALDYAMTLERACQQEIEATTPGPRK